MSDSSPSHGHHRALAEQRDETSPARPSSAAVASESPAPTASRGPADEPVAAWWGEVVRNAADVIFTLDPARRFTSINPAGERLFGYSSSEIVRLTLFDVAAPDSLAGVLDETRSAFDRVEGVRFDLHVLTRDRRRIPLEISARPMSPGGTPRGLLCMGRELTTRSVADESLRGADQRFRVLVEHGAASVLFVSRERRISFASRAASRLLGFAPEQIVGRDLFELVHPDDRDRMADAWAESVEQPATPVRVEYHCRDRQATWRLHEATLASHLDQPGIHAIVVSVRDVTEQRAAETALHESEQRFRAVFESAFIGIARLSLDGRVLEVNRAIVDVVGSTAHELHGQLLTGFLHPDDEKAAIAELRELASGERSSSRAERRYRTRDGRVVWVDVTTVLVRSPNGIPQFVLAVLENITERKQAEVELRETNQRLSIWVEELEGRTREIGLLGEMGDLLQACRSAEEACAVVVPIARRLFPGSAGTISIVGARTPGVLDPLASWGGAPGQEPFNVEECWALRRGRPHAVGSRSEGPFCRHLAPLAGDAAICVPMMAHGQLLGVLSLVMPEASSLPDARQRLALTVSEHVSLALATLRLEETLRSQSIRDPLTGLFNRRYMEESLEREMRRAVRNRTSIAIMMLDLDHFKSFNDTHGHEAGDAVLRELGAVLQRSIRAEDIACRYGGEEFTLILPEASLHEAAQRAEYIRNAVKQVGVSYRRQVLPPVTISAGVATHPDHGPTADAVLRAADAALYQAKARGRDRAVLHQTGGLFPEAFVELGRPS